MDYQQLDFAARLSLAEAVDTSLNILMQLAWDPNEQVRQAVALNSNASEALLCLLLKEFPIEVFQNSTTRILWLENPYSSFSRLVLAPNLAIASNAETSTESLEELFKVIFDQGHRHERYKPECHFDLAVAIASNPNTPAPLLEKLYREKEVIAGAPLGTLDYGVSDWKNIGQLESSITQNPNWREAFPDRKKPV